MNPFVRICKSPIIGGIGIIVAHFGAHAATIELRPVLAETNGVVTIGYRSGNTLVGRSSASAPAGVELLLPGADAAPVKFRAKIERNGIMELGPAKVGALTLRLRLEQKNPSLLERTRHFQLEGGCWEIPRRNRAPPVHHLGVCQRSAQSL